MGGLVFVALVIDLGYRFQTIHFFFNVCNSVLGFALHIKIRQLSLSDFTYNNCRFN